MHILSAEVRTENAQKRLRVMRRWATSLLVLAFILFIIATWLLPKYPLLGYLKAFSEAAMVGALADWFAVTALFRHPLGLPIPHTAILPKNQHRIADELGRFIEHNFLQGKPIALRVYQASPSEKLLQWAARTENRARWLPWLASQIPALLHVAKPEQVARFGSQMLDKQYSGDKIGKTLANIMVVLKEQSLHQTMLLVMLKQMRRWLQNPHTRALLEKNLHDWAAKIESDAPSTWEKIKASLKGTVVDRVDGWVATKVLDWVDDYLAAALKEPEHMVRQQFTLQYDRIGEALEHSRLWHKKLEQNKQQLAQSAALQESMMRLWCSLQNWSAQDVQKDDSLWVAQIEKLLNHMLSQAQQYPKFMRRLDLRISLMVRDFVQQYKDRAALFVSEKVKSWDSSQMVEKLELSVGRDLQFIRINGTLVGGLVGLIIYVVSNWITA